MNIHFNICPINDLKINLIRIQTQYIFCLWTLAHLQQQQQNSCCVDELLFSSAICWPDCRHIIKSMLFQSTSVGVKASGLQNRTALIIILHDFMSIKTFLYPFQAVDERCVGRTFRSEQCCVWNEFGSSLVFLSVLSCFISLLFPSLLFLLHRRPQFCLFFSLCPAALVPLEKLKGNLGYEWSLNNTNFS